MGRRSDAIDPFDLPDVPSWARIRTHPWHPHVFHVEDVGSLYAASGDVMRRLLVPGVALPSNYEQSCIKVAIKPGVPALEQMIQAALQLIREAIERQPTEAALNLERDTDNG